MWAKTVPHSACTALNANAGPLLVGEKASVAWGTDIASGRSELRLMVRVLRGRFGGGSRYLGVEGFLCSSKA
jgi:hypothetical protein